MWPPHRLALALLASGLAACGEDPIAPGPDTGPLVAYIDGDAFIADSASFRRMGLHALDIVVEAWGPGGRTIGFEFVDDGPANYAIGPGNDVHATLSVGSSVWTAGPSSGSGVLTLTSVFPTRLEGTFELTLLGGGSPQSRNVTQGAFILDSF